MTDLTSIIFDAMKAEMQRQAKANGDYCLPVSPTDSQTVFGFFDLTALSQAIARAVEMIE